MSQINLTEILLLINNVDNYDELVEKASDFDNFNISGDAAKEIIKYRNSFDNKKIKDINGILDSHEIPNDFKESIRVLIREHKTHSTDYPFLLLPLRLETRFMKNNLWIRIYPDQIFLNTHVSGVTEKEYHVGQEFIDTSKKLIKNDEISEEDREHFLKDNWRKFAAELGSQRASYVFRYIEENGKPDKFHDEQNDFLNETNLQAMPKRFVAYAYARDGKVFKQVGNSIPSDLDVIREENVDENLFSSSTHWVINLQTAKKNGMAICLENIRPEDKEEGFEKVIVVGIGGTEIDKEEETLHDLIDNHHYSSGISFCEFYTPTNNTGSKQSGYSESIDNYEETYNVEIKGSEAFTNPNMVHEYNAQVLSRAFGIDGKDEVFRYLRNAGDRTLSHAQEMNSCIWPASGKFFLNDLLNNVIKKEDIKDIEIYFTSFVRALGHLPSIQIDTQPYGILPVTSILPASPTNLHGWKSSDKDSVDGKKWRVFDAKLHGILLQLFKLWKDISLDPESVPKMSDSSDPDKSLISILSMEPVSQRIKARPMLSENFQNWLVVALRNSLFKKNENFHGNFSSENWAREWYVHAQERKSKIARYIATLTGLDASKIDASKLLNLFAWDKSDDIDIDFDYFSRLSLLLISEDPEEQKKLIKSINFLKNSSALEFINSAHDAKQIVKRIVDDPFFIKKHPKAYGIKEKIAEKILQVRDDKAGKQFKIIDELLDIEGIGPDTLHDFLYSFINIDYTLLLKFFNDVSDAEEIVNRIKDDPAYLRAGSKAKGISTQIAQEILNLRNTLPDKAFSDVSQIFDVKGIGNDTAHDILFSFVMKNETLDINLLFNSTLDLFSHRLDAWISSLAYQRLEAMRQKNKKGTYLGAYGWVENLKADDSISSDSDGYIHTPSRGQASAAAVLYNGFLAHKEEENSPLKINLESLRVRKAMQIIEGMRQGQPLGALLGYMLERNMHDASLDKYIDEFRAAFPISISEKENKENISNASIPARNVTNGLSLIRWLEDPIRQDINLGTKDEIDKVTTILKDNNDSDNVNVVIHSLKSSFDAVNDLLLYESVYHTVQGNYERASTFIDAMAGKNSIPDIESIKTPLQGQSFENKVCLFFPKPDENKISTFVSPRAKAEPRLAKWISTLFSPFENMQIFYTYRTFKLNINRKISEKNKVKYLEELKAIPGISDVLAEHIIAFKQNKTIKKLTELTQIEGIGESLVDELENWVYLGTDVSDDAFLDLININTASAELLAKLPGIGLQSAEKIVAYRMTEGSFSRIAELVQVEGISKLQCDELRRFCTVNENKLTFSTLNTDSFGEPINKEIQLHPLDIFYLSVTEPGGGETEIEQRIKYWIRQEHHLGEDDIITIEFDQKSDTGVSYLDLLQLSQQIIKLIGKASPLRPNDLTLPDEKSSYTYRENDITSLKLIWEQAFSNLQSIYENLSGMLDADSETSIEALLRASLYNIPIAIPRGINKEDLSDKIKLTIDEIDKKKVQYHKQTEKISEITAQDTPDYNRVLSEIINGIKGLLGQEFVVLPTFTSENEENLYALFNQSELLGDQGSERIRLWIQQVATTQSSVNEMENMMLFTDTLLQEESPHFSLKVGQLPYVKGNRWLGLSEDERVLFKIGKWNKEDLNKNKIPLDVGNGLSGLGHPLSGSAAVHTSTTGEWRIVDTVSEYVLKIENDYILVILKSSALNNTSVVAAYCGEEMFTDSWRESDKSVCGLKIDAWHETIPNETVESSVAFHYDGPNSKAPQALLLAVPPDRDKSSWEVDDLVQIVNDTMDLYKIRAVDFEALSLTKETADHPVGAFLPSVIVPIDARKKGWEKLGDSDLITDWLSKDPE